MKKVILMGLALLFAGQNFAFALSSSRGGGKKALIRTNDANGNPLQIDSDKGWKAFEYTDVTTEVQVTDESGVAPAQGILHRVCIESGVAAVDYLLIWDTSTQTGGVRVLNRRLLPALFVASTYGMTCTPGDLNILFTAGLRVLQSSAVNRNYIYWRGLGDSR